jgi:hypothetical protein
MHDHEPIEAFSGPVAHLLEVIGRDLEGLQLQRLPPRLFSDKYETIYLGMRRVASYVRLWVRV